MKIFSKLFQKFCRHEWVFSEYQVLIDDGTMTYVCKKCGKYEQQEWRK